MTDAEVWEMPSRRFWSMENQINRILASMDLRELNLKLSVNQQDKKAIERIQESLTLELGETAKIRRAKIVAPEPDAKAKFMSVL